MDALIGVAVGVGLSAAVGFRIFIPPLVMCIAARAGHLELPQALSWMDSTVALIAFSAAAIVEVAAYYIPLVDNLLDTVEVPLAGLAGTFLAAGFIGEALGKIDPNYSRLLMWTAALIVGGGAAEAVQGLTSLTRLGSTATTGGVGNPVVSTAEAGGATALSVLAIVVPLAALAVVVLIVVWVLRKLIKYFFSRRRAVRPPGDAR